MTTSTQTPRARIAVVGGGAGGFFAAITAAEADPRAKVTLYESGSRFLRKVKISGGGRCNVTHACFEPAELCRRYPRGARELRGAFHRWQPRDTFQWFEDRGVSLKTEEDGRVFPSTDRSQTIIDCLLGAAERAGVVLRPRTGVTGITQTDGDTLELALSDGSTASATAVCVATGSLQASSRASSVSSWLRALGHTIEPLAPSLFAFNVSDARTRGLSGVSVANARVRLLPDSTPQEGPLLITHRGLSGPAVLKLSAWEARTFQRHGYRAEIAIHWLADVPEHEVRERVAARRREHGAATVAARPFDEIPRRLWKRIVEAAAIPDATRWAELSREGADGLVRELTDARFQVSGKTTNKDEFVTCGGVRLSEVDFRTMESRVVPGLYFAGECMDIDGVTGGFNFQAAWTSGHIAGTAMASRASFTRDPPAL